MGYLRLRSRRVEVRGRAVTLEWVEFPPVVAVLPITDDGEIVLVEQYRAPLDRWTVEVPAGAADPGEPLEDAARRELAEETGYRAAHLERLASFYPAIGYSSEEITIFVARGLVPGETDFDEAEDIRVVLRTPEQVEEMVRRGVIRDSKSMLAFLLWRQGTAPFPEPGRPGR